MRTARVFDMGVTAVEDAAPNTSQRWGSIAAVARLPTPYTTVNADGPGVNDGIWEFVAATPGDKPWLVSVPQIVGLPFFPTGQHIVSADPSTIFPVAVTVVGTTRETAFGGTEPRNSYVFWAPRYAIGQSGETMAQPVLEADTQDFAAKDRAKYSIQFKNSGRTYQIARKESQGLSLVHGVHTKLFGYDGDFLKSHLPSQTDLTFPYSQLVITSNDLNQIPERDSSGANTKPILSSYTLHQTDAVSVDKEAQVAGGTSSPWGDVHFSEQGTRRFHHLSATSGGLRQFTLNAEVTYKDPKRETKVISLPPGARFKAQILFIRKME